MVDWKSVSYFFWDKWLHNFPWIVPLKGNPIDAAVRSARGLQTW